MIASSQCDDTINLHHRRCLFSLAPNGGFVRGLACLIQLGHTCDIFGLARASSVYRYIAGKNKEGDRAIVFRAAEAELEIANFSNVLDST